MAKVSPDYLIQGLIDRGFKPHEAAGIVGNVAVENSGFDTGAKEVNPMTESARKQGGGFGLFQWTSPERKQGLYNMAQMNGKAIDDPDLQLDYFTHEMQTSHKKALKALEATKDPRRAAFAISRHYEIPSEQYAHNDRRMSAADKFFNMINPIGTAQASEFPELPVLKKSLNDLPILKRTEEEPSLGDTIKQGAKDVGGGLFSAASAVPNAIMSAGDTYNEILGNKYALSNLDSTHKERETQLDETLKNDFGVNPDSMTFKASKLGGQVLTGGGVAKAAGKLAESIPYVAPLAESIASGGMRGADMAQKVIGGGLSGLAQTSVISPDDKTEIAGMEISSPELGGLIGAALPPALKVSGKAGQIAGKGLSKAGSAMLPKVSDEVKALAAKAEKYGIDIPLDRLTDSKPLNAVASGLNYVPFSGRAATEEALNKQLFKAASRTVGQDTDNITKALRDANKVLGQKFDDTLQTTNVKITPTFKKALSDIETEADAILVGDQLSAIKKQINNILDKGASGEIEGKAAYNIKKLLDTVSKSSDSEKAKFARDLRGSLMDALNDSLGPDKAKGFAEVRKQYGNMLELEKIAQNGAEGGISIARLGNLKGNKSQELRDLADIAAQFVKPRESQHGAMQRAVAGMAAFSTAGAPGLALGATVGRGANQVLKSKKLRDAALGKTKKAVGGKLAKMLANESAAKAIPVIATQ